MKNRHAQPATEIPGARRSLEQVIQFRADVAEQAGQRNGREIGRPGDANVGVRRDELLFRLANVGPPLQQFGGQARRRGRLRQSVERPSPRNRVGIAPDQQADGVLALSDGGFQLRDLDRRRLILRLRLAHVQFRGQAGLEPKPGDAQRFGAGLQGAAADRQLLIQRAQLDVVVGHARHQRQNHRAPGFLGRQQISLRRFGGAARRPNKSRSNDSKPTACTLAVAATTFALLIGMERQWPHSPAPLVAVGGAIAASWFFGLQALGVSTVGLIPQGFPALTLPDLALIQQLAPGALGIALMSFTETIAAGRAFTRPADPPIDANRELIATGAANLGVPDLEYSALQMLMEGEKRATELGAVRWLVGLNPGVLEIVRRAGLAERLSRERMLFNAREAIARYQALQATAGGTAESAAS